MIKKIENQPLKLEITDTILHALPDWFGIEASTKDYMQGVQDKPFYAYYIEDKPVGFISVKHQNAYTAEIYVMGILTDNHRQGIGRKLVEAIETDLRKENYRFLMVKTVGPTSDDPYYHKTRMFYESLNFYPLEEIKEIWDVNNPCLIMIKTL